MQIKLLVLVILKSTLLYESKRLELLMLDCNTWNDLTVWKQ